MSDDFAAFGISAGAAWEKPGRHLDHDFFPDVKSRDSVKDQFVDEAPSAVVWTNLLKWRLLPFGNLVRIPNVVLIARLL